MTAPHTRVDKIVWLRERREETALASLARARAGVERAREVVTRAMAAAQADARVGGRVELWLLDDDGHRRAVEALHEAELQEGQAVTAAGAAIALYADARRETLAARRVQERRRAAARVDLLRRERRELDEIAALGSRSRGGRPPRGDLWSSQGAS